MRKRHVKQPPVHEKQNRPGSKYRPYTLPCNLLAFDSDGTHAGYGQQKHCHQFCPKDTAEYTGCSVKIHQYPVYDIQIQMPGAHAGIAVHINVDYQNKNTDSPAEFHAKTHKDGNNYSYLCIKQIKVRI